MDNLHRSPAPGKDRSRLRNSIFVIIRLFNFVGVEYPNICSADLIFDRRTSRTAPLLPDIALHTLAPGDDDGNDDHDDHDDHDGDDDYNNDDGNSPGTGPPGYTSPPSCQPLPWGGLHHDPDPQPTK